MRPSNADIKRHLFTALISVIIILIPLTAVAAPSTPEIEAKQEEALGAQSHLDDLQAELEMRAEEYAVINEKLQSTRADVSQARDNLVEVEKELNLASDLLERRAAGIYRSGGVEILEVLLETTSFQDFLTRVDFLRRVNDGDATIVASVKQAREEVRVAKESLERREEEQIRPREQAAMKQKEVEAAVASQRSFVSNLNTEAAELVEAEQKRQERLAAERARQAEEAARKAAEEAARLAASSEGGANSGDENVDTSSLGAGHPEAVAIGLKYIGVPYLWGGSSPSGFDCSGLTQYVYAEIGISIPRNSRSQFKAGAYIPPGRMDLLFPGDLVFFGYDGDSSRIHHVGIYTGGGNYLHAPQTGQNVQVSSLTERITLRGDYVGGCRP